MRKLAAAAVSAAALAGAAVAVASTTWPSVHVTPTVTPSKAGTVAHPQGVKLTTALSWQNLGPTKQPIVTKFFVWFPQGSLYQGGKYTSCSKAKIAKGPGACPSKSIMGTGTGTAYAGSAPGAPLTHPKITVVNGGAKTIYFYTVLNNPARVRKAVVGTLSSATGKYRYKLSVPVPTELQVVAGTPIELTNLNVTAGGKSYAPRWLATTACPGGNWPFKVTTDYLNPNNNATGSASTTASVKCS
jgi:hypothetical protein